MRQEQRDDWNTYVNNAHDEIEATDDNVRGVAYTFIAFLAFALGMICTLFFVIWQIASSY